MFLLTPHPTLPLLLLKSRWSRTLQQAWWGRRRGPSKSPASNPRWKRPLSWLKSLLPLELESTVVELCGLMALASHGSVDIGRLICKERSGKEDGVFITKICTKEREKRKRRRNSNGVIGRDRSKGKRVIV